MEHLRIRADQFRKQGRSQEEDLEQIINDMKAEGTFKEDNRVNGKIAALEEHKRVIEAIKEGLLQVHSIAPNTKQPGRVQFLGENCNGFNNRIRGNNKISKSLDIKEELDINCLMYCKHWQKNFSHRDSKIDLKQMFQQELVCTAVSENNVHENKHTGRVQEGGTGTICFGDITGYVKKVGRDEDGLGQWSWILLVGTAGHTTQVITAYNPSKNKNINSGTSYQQQHRYFIMKKKDKTCPLILFWRHLVKQLRQWRASRDMIVLFMDHNEHMIEGKLGQVLADREGLNLREAILSHTGASPGAAFFQGLRPIDGLLVSSDHDISNVCVTPFGFGVGDHHAC